jgi:hypothetical protein
VASSESSSSSWDAEEKPLEEFQATASFRSWRWHRFAARFDKATASEDTPDQGKEFRGKNWGRAYLESSETSGLGRRHLRAPARDFVDLAAWFGQGEEGNWRGGGGGLSRLGAEAKEVGIQAY